MTNGSTSRRFVVAALALACVSLAVMWPTWRTVLAQAGGYDSSFLGCVGSSGNLIVVLASGPDAPVSFGGDCADALNSLDASCDIVTETRAAEPGFGVLIRITCPF